MDRLICKSVFAIFYFVKTLFSLGLGSIFLGLFAQSVYHFIAEAANQFIDPQVYNTGRVWLKVFMVIVF